MTFDHDFGYSFPLFSSILEKEGRRKGEWIAKIVIKSHAFCSIVLRNPYHNIFFPITINIIWRINPLLQNICWKNNITKYFFDSIRSLRINEFNKINNFDIFFRRRFNLSLLINALRQLQLDTTNFW